MPSIWFKHPVDSLSDDVKLKALVRKYGSAGYSAYFALLEKLYRKDGKAVSDFEAESIGRDLKIDPQKMLEILDYAAGKDCDELIQKTDRGYESTTVSHFIKHNRKVANQRSERSRRAAQARWRKAQEC